MAAAMVTWGPVAPAQDAAPVSSAWKTVPAASVSDPDLVAVNLKDRIVVWNDARSTEAATEAWLLADVPFDKARKAVDTALKGFGDFDVSTENRSLADLPDAWDEVLLSRRADLRDALAKRSDLPKLTLALKEGVLTAEEVERRMDAARAVTTSAPQYRQSVDAYRVTYPEYYATQDRSYGLLRRSGSELVVHVFDVSAIFGHAATVVRISRADTFPNPDYAKQQAQRTVLSSPVQGKVTYGVVPAPLFEAVHAVLASANPGAAVQVASRPSFWMVPVKTKSGVPTMTLVPPQAGRLPIEAESIPWAAIANAQSSAISYAQDLIALPGGDLLLSVEVLGGGVFSSGVWRLYWQDGQWKETLVWQNKDIPRQLVLSADGHTVWFSSSPANTGDFTFYAYDVASQKVSTYKVNQVGARDAIKYQPWELSDGQWPVYFDHSYATKDAGPLGYQRFEAFQPTGKPPADGGAWSFQPTLKSARQVMMDVPMKGNTQIAPVRWRGQTSFWTEDASGIAELGASNGHVLRAFQVPQRFGTPDSNDATGGASWVPRALGSPEAGWIATGFVLSLTDDGSMPPKIEGKPDRSDRFVGMHVVNVKDGSVRLSALLGRADTLKAAARSANGRLLALGSNGVRAGPKVALWDMAKSQTSLQLTAPGRGELHALAFSWNGADLWALTTSGILHWRIPDALIDAASHGSFPDQSRD
ncbi:hypothetical protein [Luteibacter rhizovicinus]|nr:hypothetical protein [Luteibacter rhizovicinus]